MFKLVLQYFHFVRKWILSPGKGLQKLQIPGFPWRSWKLQKVTECSSRTWAELASVRKGKTVERNWERNGEDSLERRGREKFGGAHRILIKWTALCQALDSNTELSSRQRCEKWFEDTDRHLTIFAAFSKQLDIYFALETPKYQGRHELKGYGRNFPCHLRESIQHFGCSISNSNFTNMENSALDVYFIEVKNFKGR